MDEEIRKQFEGEVRYTVGEAWMEVDLLDLHLIETTMNDRVTRKQVADTFDNITKEQARSRLESLVDEGIIQKIEMCRYCDNLISECECGNYAKKVLYHLEASEQEVQMIRKFRDLVDELGDSIA